MKNNHYRLVACLCLMALFAFASCQKEERRVAFTATMENPTIQGKTVFNSTTGTITWEEYDNIYIYNPDNWGWYWAEPTGSGSTANFYYDDWGTELTSGPYFALYPPTINGGGYQQVWFTNSPEVEDSFTPPMCAFSNTNQLKFKNLCGLIQLKLTAERDIDRIEVYTENNYIGGYFNVRNIGGVPTLVPIEDSRHEKCFACDEAVNCSEGYTFNLFLPPGTYTKMEITIIDTDDNACTLSLNEGESLTVVRSEGFPITVVYPTFSPISSEE